MISRCQAIRSTRPRLMFGFQRVSGAEESHVNNLAKKKSLIHATYISTYICSLEGKHCKAGIVK